MLIKLAELVASCQRNGMRPFVHWGGDGRASKSVCNASTKNCWDDYFQSLQPVDNLAGNLAVCQGESFFASALRADEVALHAALRREFSKRFADNFVLEPSLNHAINAFKTKHFAGHHVLGVQVRATDYSSEHGEPLVDPTDWIDHARQLFQQLASPKRIFIASDNQPIVDRFVREFGKAYVLHSDAPRASNYSTPDVEPHERCTGTSTSFEGEQACRISYGKGTLMDLWLLAESEHFLFWDGSLAKLVLLKNPSITPHYIGKRGSHGGSLQDLDSDGVTTFEACTKPACRDAAAMYGLNLGLH